MPTHTCVTLYDAHTVCLVSRAALYLFENPKIVQGTQAKNEYDASDVFTSTLRVDVSVALHDVPILSSFGDSLITAEDRYVQERSEHMELASEAQERSKHNSLTRETCTRSVLTKRLFSLNATLARRSFTRSLTLTSLTHAHFARRYLLPTLFFADFSKLTESISTVLETITLMTLSSSVELKKREISSNVVGEILSRRGTKDLAKSSDKLSTGSTKKNIAWKNFAFGRMQAQIGSGLGSDRVTLLLAEVRRLMVVQKTLWDLLQGLVYHVCAGGGKGESRGKRRKETETDVCQFDVADRTMMVNALKIVGDERGVDVFLRRYVTVHCEVSESATEGEVWTFMNVLRRVVTIAVEEGAETGEWVRKYCDLELVEACVWDYCKLGTTIYRERNSEVVQIKIREILNALSQGKEDAYIEKVLKGYEGPAKWEAGKKKIEEDRKMKISAAKDELALWMILDHGEQTRWI